MVAHASVATSKPKVADMCVVGDKCSVIHNHNRPVNVYSYDPKDGHRSAKTVDATVGYQDPQSGQKFILMINQAICIDGLVNHLLCPMQCHLNGVHINDVPKFLAETPSETTHAIELVNPFDATHSLIILLQLSSVTSYFDVYSPSVTDNEGEDISQRFISLQKSHFGIHQQVNIQKERLECWTIKARLVSLPQQKGDQYLSVQFSHTHWLMMPLMLWIMTIWHLHWKLRFRSLLC